MGKTFRWTVVSDSTTYEVSLTVNQWSNNHVCMINGEQIDLPRKFRTFFTGLDHPLELGSKVAHLMIIGGNADLAVDDVFLGTENPYIPLTPVPGWAWIFVVILSLLAVSLSPLAIVIGFYGVLYCIRTVVSPYYSTGMKVSYCIAITLGCWFAFLFILSLAGRAGLFS